MSNPIRVWLPKTWLPESVSYLYDEGMVGLTPVLYQLHHKAWPSITTGYVEYTDGKYEEFTFVHSQWGKCGDCGKLSDDLDRCCKCGMDVGGCCSTTVNWGEREATCCCSHAV